MEVVVHLWRSLAASSSRIDCIDQCKAANALNETGSVTTSRLRRTNQGARRRLRVRLLKSPDSCATRVLMTCDIGP
jgi:hypothetical protein